MWIITIFPLTYRNSNGSKIVKHAQFPGLLVYTHALHFEHVQDKKQRQLSQTSLELLTMLKRMILGQVITFS